MFAYNPAPDRSGEILGNASAQAAATRAQGTAQFSQALSDSINTISNIYMKKQEQNQADAKKMESNISLGQSMMNLSSQYGEDGKKFQASLSKALSDANGNPDKTSGALMAHMPVFQSFITQDNYDAQYSALGNAYAQRSAAKALQPPKMNAEYIRSMAADAKAAGFTDEQIKGKLQTQYGDWAVRSVYPPQNQGIWMGQ